MKKLRALAVLLVLGGAAAFGWYTYGQPEAATAPTTATVTRGTVEETVLASGNLQASAIVSVGAQVSGRIDTLAVKLGDTVKAGDLIAQIDSLDQENAVKTAEASLANAQAQLRAQQATVTLAQQAMDRAAQLATQKLASQADYDSAAADLEKAKAQVDALNAQIDQATLAVESAKLDLSRTKITAPMDGTVVAIVAEAGTTVNASNSTPTIVKIADLDTMIIKAQISEADITKVAPGQSAYFSILGEPQTRIEATLLSTEPAPTAITTSDTAASSDSAVYYNGVFEVQNPDHKLRIAMTAEITIVLEKADNALVISSSLLGTPDRNGKYTVTVYDPATGETSPRAITVGLNNNILAEVTAGLKEGDAVVTSAGATVTAAKSTNTRSGTASLLGGMGGPPSGGPGM